MKAEAGGIGRWERGECVPHLEIFRRMCLVFGCSADDALQLSSRKRTADLCTQASSDDGAAA